MVIRDFTTKVDLDHLKRAANAVRAAAIKTELENNILKMRPRNVWINIRLRYVLQKMNE